MTADISNADYLERLSQLAPRQRQVAECLVEGMSLDEIAAEMGIALDTVRAHIKSVCARFGVSGGRARLTAFLISASTTA